MGHSVDDALPRRQASTGASPPISKDLRQPPSLLSVVTRKYTTVEECVKRMEEGFWNRYNTNPDLRAKLAGKERVIQLALTDGHGYWFHIKEGKLAEVQHGIHPRPDATVSVSKHDLVALFNKEIAPMQAYMSGRVRVKAGLTDMLFAKSLLG